MTTTTMTRPGQPDPAQLDRATALAARLLARHTNRTERKPATAAAFGRALVVTTPGSQHGKLLAAALHPARWQDRPHEQQLILGMARRGETPTAAALASRLEQIGERRAHHQRLRDAAAPIAERDAAKAAAFVAETLRDTGAGPTWTELARKLGWSSTPYTLREAIIRDLVAGGWLRTGTGPRSLRPGPKATKDDPR